MGATAGVLIGGPVLLAVLEQPLDLDLDGVSQVVREEVSVARDAERKSPSEPKVVMPMDWSLACGTQHVTCVISRPANSTASSGPGTFVTAPVARFSNCSSSHSKTGSGEQPPGVSVRYDWMPAFCSSIRSWMMRMRSSRGAIPMSNGTKTRPK